MGFHYWRMIRCSWSSALPYRVEIKLGRYDYYTLYEPTNQVFQCDACNRFSYANPKKKYDAHGVIMPEHHDRRTIQRGSAGIKSEGDGPRMYE